MSPPSWPVQQGDFLVREEGSGPTYARIAFGRGATGRVVLVTLGTHTEGEVLDRRIPLLDNEYHRERSDLADDTLARHAPGGTADPPVSVLVICMGYAQENHAILVRAMERAGIPRRVSVGPGRT